MSLICNLYFDNVTVFKLVQISSLIHSKVVGNRQMLGPLSNLALQKLQEPPIFVHVTKKVFCHPVLSEGGSSALWIKFRAISILNLFFSCN